MIIDNTLLDDFGDCGCVEGLWHTLRALESGTVILEMKDGAYEPIGAGDVMER